MTLFLFIDFRDQMVDTICHFVKHETDVMEFLHREVSHTHMEVILTKCADLLCHFFQRTDRPVRITEDTNRSTKMSTNTNASRVGCSTV